METFLRSTIMLGTLIVGGMALYLYGPPPEEAASMLEGALERGSALIAEFSTNASGPTPTTTRGPAPASLAPAPPTRSLSAQSSWLNAAAPLSPLPNTALSNAPLPSMTMRTAAGRRSIRLASHAELAPLAAELQRLGATDLDLQPWGDAGSLYRFQCAAPISGGGGFTKHCESIDRSPEAAVLAVLYQVRGEPLPGLVSAVR